jgi:hypothetical protein
MAADAIFTARRADEALCVARQGGCAGVDIPAAM